MLYKLSAFKAAIESIVIFWELIYFLNSHLSNTQSHSFYSSNFTTGASNIYFTHSNSTLTTHWSFQNLSQSYEIFPAYFLFILT